MSGGGGGGDTGVGVKDEGLCGAGADIDAEEVLGHGLLREESRRGSLPMGVQCVSKVEKKRGGATA